MAWELIIVDDTEWMQDDSCLYTLISYIKPNMVRLDIMTDNDEPVISFQGKAGNVRKHAMRWSAKHRWLLSTQSRAISLEHAAYIGCELARAEMLGVDYVQD